MRKAAGIPFDGATYPDEFIMADAELDWELPDGDLLRVSQPAGFFAAFAMPGRHRFRIERAYRGLVTARVISAERYADGYIMNSVAKRQSSALGDPDRTAHRHYGVEQASAFVIRPDGYVGYRGVVVRVRVSGGRGRSR